MGRKIDFEERSVVVVGAGHGIGRAAALEFAAAGASVTVADLDSAAAEMTVQAIKDRGGQAVDAQCDVTDFSSCQQLVQSTVDAEGRVDALINVAGWTDTTLFADESPEYWKRIVDLNLMGSIHLCGAVSRVMIEQNSGVIVLTSSDAGRVGTKGETVYSASKAGVIGLVKSLAREWSRYGIRINAVSPGPTETRLLREAGDQAIIDRMVRSIPMRRVATPQEQADAMLFLASDLSSYITGQTLSVSGGLTMSS